MFFSIVIDNHQCEVHLLKYSLKVRTLSISSNATLYFYFTTALFI